MWWMRLFGLVSQPEEESGRFGYKSSVLSYSLVRSLAPRHKQKTLEQRTIRWSSGRKSRVNNNGQLLNIVSMTSFYKTHL